MTFGAQDLLATGSADGDVRIWDTATGECSHVLSVHPQGVWPLLFNEGGTLLAAGSADGTLRVWEAASGTLRCELTGHTSPIYTAVFGSDGTSLITGDASANVRVWDVTTGGCGRCCRKAPGRCTVWRSARTGRCWPPVTISG
ncbi:WD40 repeat domain-containing protein [Streptosporangium lutulentum]